MIVRRLLTTESKRNIKEAFKADPVFRTIDAAYKAQETRMKTLRFSPEEIWVNCFTGFDQILKNRDEIDEIVNRMWYDTYCELRDEALEASREFNDEELERATSCIIYSIIACMIASGDWQILQHTETLMTQIAEHSELQSVAMPFDGNIEGNFAGYVQRYISTGNYLSDRLGNPNEYTDPINPVISPQERIKVKVGVRKRLEFMKGALPDSETPIMTTRDFNAMMEAVEYLIENDVVKKQESKISTAMPVAHLRYTFYLVYKNEGKSIPRQLWLDFLGESFSQMQNNKDSLSKHFADKPSGYDVFVKQKKKK